MSELQLVDLLRLVSSGSVSLWCRGIKGNVALCQRLDPFSPLSRNAKGQRDGELTIWRLIISGLTEIGHEAHPAEDTHTHALSFSCWWDAGRFAWLIWATKHKHWLFPSREQREGMTWSSGSFFKPQHPFIVLFSPCLAPSHAAVISYVDEQNCRKIVNLN